MKTMKPIQGQTYMGYYHNDSNEEHVIEGICRKYSDEMVLVNERGAWVPFAKLNENSYPTEPLAEDILREAVRHYLYDDIQITKQQLIELFENGSDEDIQTLYEATKEDITIALDALGINAEDLDDETLNAIEDAVVGDELETPEDEEVAGIPDSAQPTIENEVEETVDETIPEETGNIADELQSELDDELQLTESKSHFTEITNEQYIALLNNREQLHKIVSSIESKSTGKDAISWNWYKYFGPLNVNEQGRKTIIDKITVIANKANQRALEARSATKDPANKNRLPELQKIIQSNSTYYEDLKKIQQYLATAPTPKEVAEAERTSATKLSVDQLADLMFLRKTALA